MIYDQLSNIKRPTGWIRRESYGVGRGGRPWTSGLCLRMDLLARSLLVQFSFGFFPGTFAFVGCWFLGHGRTPVCVSIVIA